jgi:hypothetical protein
MNAEDERGASRVSELLLRSPKLRQARIAELEVLYAAARAEAERLEPGAQAEGMARVEYVRAQDRAVAVFRSLKWLRALRRGKLAYVLKVGLYESISPFLLVIAFTILRGKFALLDSVEFWQADIVLLPLLIAHLLIQGVLSWKSEERAYASLQDTPKEGAGPAPAAASHSGA